MKITAVAVAASMFAATSAMALDLGGGLSLGTEVDASYDFDAENTNVNITPELGYTTLGAEITLDMTINVYDQEEFVLTDAFDKPVLNLGVEYPLGLVDGMKIYGNTSYDWDKSEAVGTKVGVSFNF